MYTTYCIICLNVRPKMTNEDRVTTKDKFNTFDSLIEIFIITFKGKEQDLEEELKHKWDDLK